MATASPPPKQKGRHPRLQVTILQRMEQRGDHACAGAADRVTQSDGAAVDVDPPPIPAETLAVRQALGGKCFVRFDEVIAVDGDAGLVPSAFARRELGR